MSSSVSKIEVSFEGLLVLFAANDRARPRQVYQVGILKQIPDHAARVTITKIAGGAPSILADWQDNQIASRLWLDVQNVTQARPVLYFLEDTSAQTFNRSSGSGNGDDFRWALDFEGPEAYGQRISVDLSGFRSVFRINNGTFSTQTRSINNLRRHVGGDLPTVVGPVAVIFKAEIQLDLAGSVAVFSNGVQNPIELKKELDTDYGIYVSHTCQPQDKGQQDSDYYYQAIGGNIAPSRRIHFDSDDARITPDAACFPGWASQTDLDP